MDAATVQRQNLRAGLLTAHLTRAGAGVFTSVRQFAQILRNEPGIEIEVLGPAAKGRDFSEWGDIKPQSLPPIGPRSFAYAPGLLRMVLDADLDLLHLNGLWMHTSCVSLAFTRKTGRPHFISPHGMLDRWALNNSGTKKKIATALFERANTTTAACFHALNASEEQSVRNYGFTGPISIIPYAIDLPDLSQPPLPVPWWSKSQPHLKTLLYLGRLHPKKGLPNLLTAWSRLDPEVRKPWHLVIAGWDELGHALSLRRMATTLKIEATVTFPGPVFGDDKKAAFQHCDGFVLPSFSEGLPLVVLETLACGKPIVMTPECNLPEAFDAGAAVRIDPQPDSITAGLTKFLSMDDAARQAMGTKGRALATERFASPVISAKLAATYRWLAGKGPKPATVVES